MREVTMEHDRESPDLEDFYQRIKARLLAEGVTLPRQPGVSADSLCAPGALAQIAAMRESVIREGTCPDCGRAFNDKGLVCPKCFENEMKRDGMFPTGVSPVQRGKAPEALAAMAKWEVEKECAREFYEGPITDVVHRTDRKWHCKAGGPVAELVKELRRLHEAIHQANADLEYKTIMILPRREPLASWVIDGE